jgi:hypothetical protein
VEDLLNIPRQMACINPAFACVQDCTCLNNLVTSKIRQGRFKANTCIIIQADKIPQYFSSYVMSVA